MSNERIRGWNIGQHGGHAFKGYQIFSEKLYFYAVNNYTITGIERLKSDKNILPVMDFAEGKAPVEIRIGLSFVSTENAKENLEKEAGTRTFEQIKTEVFETWERLLSKVQVTGGTEREKRLFYSCLYRSFLWPALRSDSTGNTPTPKEM